MDNIRPNKTVFKYNENGQKDELRCIQRLTERQKE